MKSDRPFTIKAYTAANQLLVSKPLYLADAARIIDVYQDMLSLGVTTYYTKQDGISKKYSLKNNFNKWLPGALSVPKCSRT